MRNGSKTISIGWKSIYQAILGMLEKNEPQLNSPEPHANHIAPGINPDHESKQVDGPDQETEKDPYLDVYCYLHMYWFI